MAEDVATPTGRHLRFADEYLIDSNATRAYKAAGFKAKDDVVAASSGSKLLRNTKVAAYIADRQQKLANKLEVTQERVLAELARIAFADPRAAAAWGPSGVVLKESSTLTDDQAAAVAEVHSKHTEHGVELKFKLHDKVAALNALGKHLGLFVERHQLELSIADLVLQAGRKAEGGVE